MNVTQKLRCKMGQRSTIVHEGGKMTLLSTSPLKGTNNKIKNMQRKTYRDMAFFKLKIMAIHEAKYA